jgi:hypothetical protein
MTYDELTSALLRTEVERDEARAIARRLREMAHPVDQDDGEVVAAFDALPWAKNRA